MKQNICKGITAVIALTMSMTACTTQDEVIGEGNFATDPTAVRISATVGSGVFTRTAPESSTPADQQKFLAGDKIVLASTATGQEAVTYTLGADGTTWTPETGKYLKWMNGTEAMQMEAFYPAPHPNNMEENNGASFTTFTLPVAQYGSADGGAYIGYADYMTYTGDVTQGDNGTASLTLERKTARVQVKINALGSEIDAADESFLVYVSSQYGGIPTTAEANKNPKGVSGNNFDYMKKDDICTALVIPGTGRSDVPFLTVLRRSVSNNDSFINQNTPLTVTGIPAMEAGKSYLYNLTIGKDKVEISSVVVKDWTSGGVIDDNGEAEEVFVSADASTHTVTLLKAGALTDAAIAAAISTEGALNIVGSMNDADFTTLRTWADKQITNSATPKLVTLDLGAVTGLTALPTGAFSPYKYIASGNYDTNVGLNSLINVTLPDAVTEIGNNAFKDCSALKSINLGKVQAIGASAFAGCTSLTGIDLSAATSIGNNGFSYCTSLGIINAPVLLILNDKVFFHCGTVSDVNLPQVTTCATNDANSNNALSYLTVTGDIRLPKCTYLMKNMFNETSVTGGLYLTTSASITMNDYAFYNTFTTAPTLFLHQNKKENAAGDATPKVSGSSWGYEDGSSTLYSGWAAIKYVDDDGKVVS